MDSPNNISTATAEIAQGTLVKDSQSNAVYRLANSLRHGNYSFVYTVELKDDAVGPPGNEHPKVAKFGYISPEDMKDPQRKERRLTDLKRRYDMEEGIINEIRRASGGRFVPAVSRGTWQVDSQKAEDISLPVLIMERMGSDQEDWSLAHQIRQLRQAGQIEDAERLAVCTGAQYAELLQILHKRLRKVCSDRKPGDYYWDSVNKRLYVLDWNVVKDLSEGSSDRSEEENKQIQAEIRQFGEHWFEMLVGNSLSASGEFSVDQPAPGSVWSQLSRGMRRLLKRTWRAGLSLDGFDNDEAAVHAWKNYSELIGLVPSSLYDQAKAAKEEAGERSLGRTRDWNETWETISDIQVLLELAQEPDAQTWAAEIKIWISNRNLGLEQQARRLMENGKDSINLGDYDKAVSSFLSVAENDRLKPEQRLKAVRHRIAAQMLSAVLGQSTDASRQLRAQLLPLLERMEKHDWSYANEQLQQIERTPINHAALNQLRYLEAETQYCLALHSVFDTKLITLKRLEAYAEAEKALIDLRARSEQLTSTYADLLEETQNYADAATVTDNLKQLQKQQETRETEEQRIRATLRTVADELGKSIDIKVWPSNLAQVLEPWDSRLDTPPYLRKLISLNRIMEREGLTLRALDAAEEAYRALDNTDSGQNQVRDVLGLAVCKLGIQRIVEFGKEPRWPYQVADGIRFGERLSRLALLDNNQTRDINAQLVKLKEYRDSQERLRKNAGILKPSDVWSLEHLQDDKIDHSLNEALSKGVELFNPIPDDQDPGKTSIARLKEAREAVDLIVLLEALSSIQSQGQELASVAGDLGERIRLVVDSTKRGQQQPDAVHEIADASTNTIRSSIDGVGRDVTKSEETLATNGSSSLLSAGDQVPPVTESGGVGGNQSETSQSGKRRVGLPSSLRSKPVLFGAAAIGIIAAILLVWTRVLPLIRVPEQIAATDEWKITIAPIVPGDSDGGTYTFLVTVKDEKSGYVANQDIVVTTTGNGQLHSEQALVAKTDRFSMLIRTNESGAQVSYGPAAVGDVIEVALAGGAVADSYQIPYVPPPSPTLMPGPVATSTPIPRPQLSLIITGTVDDHESEVARPGQKLNYRIKATNQGEGEAKNVTLQCTPPTGVTLDSPGEFEWSGDSLSKQWTSFAAGQSFDSDVSFIVSEDAPIEADMVLKCSLRDANDEIPETSSTVKFVGPEPIWITLLPQVLDIGIDESVEVTIRVQQGESGKPIASRDLVIQAEPGTLLFDVGETLTTDQNGEAVVLLRGREVGRGLVKAVLQDSGESGSAVLDVRPVVTVPTAFIRRSPNDGEALDVADRSKPFQITGRLQDGVWLRIRLPDGREAWVSKNTQGTTTSGDITGVPILNPSSDSGESTSSVGSFNSQLSVTSGQRQLVARSGSGVAFYRINRIEDDPIIFLPPQGSVEVQPPESPTPPNEYVLVTVRFWVKQEFVSSGQGTWSFQNLVSDDWACWQAPGGDPSTEPENCGLFPRTVGGPIFLSSNVVPLENNRWSQVVIKAWVKQENLAQ